MAFQLQLGGLTLDGIVELTRESPSRVHADTFPRREGAVVTQLPLLSQKPFRFTGIVMKDSEAELESYLEALEDKLDSGEVPLVLRDTNRYITVVKQTFGETRRAAELPTTSARIFIDLVAGDPYFYATSESTSGVQTITASPQSFTVTNNGGAYAHPRIEFKAVGANKTNVKLSNTTVGQAVQFTGTILNGQTLVIDCKRQTATNGAQNALKESSIDKMILRVGANNLLYEGPSSGVEVTVLWTNAYRRG